MSDVSTYTLRTSGPFQPGKDVVPLLIAQRDSYRALLVSVPKPYTDGKVFQTVIQFERLDGRDLLGNERWHTVTEGSDYEGAATAMAWELYARSTTENPT